ncbi:MAG: hypothetical protein JWM82_3365 [Myxococcales bacterium]|nr:hypothetical protein [Myxococcales bacterium]
MRAAIGNASRVGLVTALLPPSVGGTEILVWRLFQDLGHLAVVSGAPAGAPAAPSELYSPLRAPTLALAYPRLRGYRYGLAPLLGAYSTAWLAARLGPAVRFLAAQKVEHIISIPHHGPFALLGLMAARRLGLPHTFYILDAWEEASTGPLERRLIQLGLRLAGRMPDSRVAAVSPALAAHYGAAYGFRDRVWIPNPAPLPEELPSDEVKPQPHVLFSGGIKPFNLDAIRCVIRALPHCRVAQKIVISGPSSGFADTLRAHGELHDRVEFTMGSRTDVAVAQRRAAVLVVATNVDDRSQTSVGYLPGRLPEYVAADRPVLLVGPSQSDASRAVRHWHLGRTTESRDEKELAAILDGLTAESLGGASLAARPFRDRFLEVFSRQEARRRLLGGPPDALSDEAAKLASEFETISRPERAAA